MGAEVSGGFSFEGLGGGLAAAITPALLIQDFSAMNGGDPITTPRSLRLIQIVLFPMAL